MGPMRLAKLNIKVFCDFPFFLFNLFILNDIKYFQVINRKSDREISLGLILVNIFLNTKDKGI